jgi:3-oxoacyl-[acyl-carrier-protein] synthase III
MQQPIPCTAALIAEALGPEADGIGCFDVNATCLSFVVALDAASHALAAGSVERVLVVSTELASRGIDWDDPASATLFGDGAAAALLERTDDAVGVLAFRIETYSEGAHLCEIPGGGSALTPAAYDGTNGRRFTFQMHGERLHRLVVEHMPGFVERLFAPLGFGPRDVDAVIPHQAGELPMRLLQRRLGLRDDTFVVTLAEHGNTIAAAIPMALHLAMASGAVKRGHRIALLGTSAGVSLGGLVWQL